MFGPVPLNNERLWAHGAPRAPQDASARSLGTPDVEHFSDCMKAIKMEYYIFRKHTTNTKEREGLAAHVKQTHLHPYLFRRDTRLHVAPVFTCSYIDSQYNRRP